MQLICAFVFAYAKGRFSDDAAHTMWVFYENYLANVKTNQNFGEGMCTIPSCIYSLPPVVSYSLPGSVAVLSFPRGKGGALGE